MIAVIYLANGNGLLEKTPKVGQNKQEYIQKDECVGYSWKTSRIIIHNHTFIYTIKASQL